MSVTVWHTIVGCFCNRMNLFVKMERHLTEKQSTMSDFILSKFTCVDRPNEICKSSIYLLCLKTHSYATCVMCCWRVQKIPIYLEMISLWVRCFHIKFILLSILVCDSSLCIDRNFYLKKIQFRNFKKENVLSESICFASSICFDY